MSALILNNRTYLFDRILSEFERIKQTDLTPYELHTLDFCQQWLSGQHTFVLKTSGSTGKPKSIALERVQMVTSAQLTGRALGLRSGDKALVCLSTEYIAGIMMLVRGFELGLELTVITPSRNPLFTFLEDAQFDFSAFVPLQLQEIITATPAKKAILNRMRAILIGGAPVSENLLVKLRTIDAPIYHTYGMTETVSHIALKHLNGPQPNDYFKALDNVALGIDRRGCLTIESPVTKHRTLYTNDLVALRPDGSFRWLGRIDNVINTGGFKVQAEKVESALAQFFQYYRKGWLAERRFFIGPLEHPRFGQAVVAIIEGESVSAAIQADIRTELLQSEIMKTYEVPRFFYFRPSLLETPSGKIDRQANLAELSHAPLFA